MYWYEVSEKTACGASSEHSSVNGPWLQKCYLRWDLKRQFLCSDFNNLRIRFSRQWWKVWSYVRRRNEIKASINCC